MKRVWIILLATVAFGNPDEFEVKELSPEAVTNLAKAEAKLEIATQVLKEAQAQAAKAQGARDEIVSRVKSEFGAFEGGRSFGSANPYTRHSRSVELRGKYALISEKTEQCGMFSNVIGTGSSLGRDITISGR